MCCPLHQRERVGRGKFDMIATSGRVAEDARAHPSRPTFPHMRLSASRTASNVRFLGVEPSGTGLEGQAAPPARTATSRFLATSGTTR